MWLHTLFTQERVIFKLDCGTRAITRSTCVKIIGGEREESEETLRVDSLVGHKPENQVLEY